MVVSTICDLIHNSIVYGPGPGEDIHCSCTTMLRELTFRKHKQGEGGRPAPCMVCVQTQCTSQDNRVMISTLRGGLFQIHTQRRSDNCSMPYKALIGTLVLLNMLFLGFTCELSADNHHTYCTCIWGSPRETTHNSGGFPALRGS